MAPLAERRYLSAPATAPLSLALLVAVACGGRTVDPIPRLLDDLEDAAEARDADRFAESLGEGFRGPGTMDKAEARATLRRYFAAYEAVSLGVYGVETEREGALARVRCRVEFSGQARKAFGLEGLLPPAALYRFDLEARDEGGGAWRVHRASWEAVEPAP